MAEGGEFLENARVFGKHNYGTPRRWLDEAKQKGLDLVLEIDVQGAAQVKEKLPGAIALFIVPPSRQELERRPRDRGPASAEENERRLNRARDEILACRKYYDYCVINDDVEPVGLVRQAIVNAVRQSSARDR